MTEAIESPAPQSDEWWMHGKRRALVLWLLRVGCLARRFRVVARILALHDKHRRRSGVLDRLARQCATKQSLGNEGLKMSPTTIYVWITLVDLQVVDVSPLGGTCSPFSMRQMQEPPNGEDRLRSAAGAHDRIVVR